MQTLTKSEMEADLRATELDIDSLERIVRHLDFFITDSHGEDRSAFKTDLLKYRALLDQARCLSNRIQQTLKNAN